MPAAALGYGLIRAADFAAGLPSLIYFDGWVTARNSAQVGVAPLAVRRIDPVRRPNRSNTGRGPRA
jgi:hypothetical protein